MISVDHHASVVIVTDPNRELFIFNGYDDGYPVIPFRGFANFLGGNADKGDISPETILARELGEELAVSRVAGGRDYAPIDDITSLLSGIRSSVKAHADFLVQDPAVRALKPGRLRESVVSCYGSEIPVELFEMASSHLKAGRKLVSEGIMYLSRREELLNGKRFLAWCSPVIFGHFLGENIPNPHHAQAIPIGKIRDSFEKYGDFSYVLQAGRANYNI